MLYHWASERIRHARGSRETDEQLCHTILEKFQRCPGIGAWAERALKRPRGLSKP